MSLEVDRLAITRRLEDGTVIARCPACAAAGADKHGEHLVVYPDGKYGCVVFPDAEGAAHRKEIWRAAGEMKRRPPVVIKFTVRTKKS